MRLINLDSLLSYPIRRSNYDKEHGSEEFINGVESVLEYAMELHVYEADRPNTATWKDESSYRMLYRCSACGNAESHPYFFCSKCGCEMTDVDYNKE